MRKNASSNQLVLLGEYYKLYMRQVHLLDAFCLEPDLPKIKTVQPSPNPSHSSDMNDLRTLMKDMKADNSSMLRLLQQMVDQPPSSPRSLGSQRRAECFVCGAKGHFQKLS